MASYKKVVEMFGENLASSLKLLSKWLDWFGSFKPLLDYFHQLRKEDLMGLVAGTHKVVLIEIDKKDGPIVLRAEIDLDAKPGLPFNSATVEKHIGGGKVVIEKCANGLLYIDGRKVILHRVVRQMNGKSIVGHELRKELDGKPVLNACILDFLMGNLGFIPEDWKKDDAGNTIYIFFWGTIFRGSNGSLYVRYFYFRDGEWQRFYDWLNRDWDGDYPAALLAS